MSEKKRLPRVELPEGVGLSTRALREGLPPSQWGENSEALYLTSSFVYPDAATAARRFADEEEAFTYSRFSNPTVMMMERRLAALEGTSGCIATASGMGAITLLAMGLLKAGDHVVCSRSVFGSTIKLLGDVFGRFGVESTFVSQTDVAEWRAAMRPNTRLLFAESPTNPLTEVCDISALADLAHDAGALLAVDNCFCSPALQRPIRLGADFVIHSGTKYLDGQGRVIAGAVVGGGFSNCGGATTTSVRYYTNDQDGQSHGAELTARYRMTPQLTAQASYTRTETYLTRRGSIVTDPLGVQIAAVPKNVAMLGATWTPLGADLDAVLGPYFGKSESHFMVVGKKGFQETKDGGKTWQVAAPLPAGFGVGRVGPNYAWDHQANIFYASSMTKPTFKFER